MDAKWVSFYLFGFAALMQVGFFVIEVFLIPRGYFLKPYQLTNPLTDELKRFVIARGWINLFLAIMTVVGLRYVTQLEVRLAGVVTSFAGAGIIIQSFVLLFQSKKFWPLVLAQSGPILLGFFFLFFHIRGSI